MSRTRFIFRAWAKTVAFVGVFFVCGVASAQNAELQPTLVAYKSAISVPPAPSISSLPESPSVHKFWDRKNRLLFASAAALSAADFTVTRSNLANGGRELNPLVRPFTANSGTLALNFVGQTAATTAISYMFHRTGHHRLERLTPAANIASSAFAVAFGMTHR